jgi:hypothetical protein
MASGVRVGFFAGASLSARYFGLGSLIFIIWAACSPQRPLSPENSGTVYLKSADSYVARTDLPPRRKTSQPSPKARPSPTPAESTPAPASPATSHHPTRTIPSVDEPVVALRERLLQRIEHLSNDEADEVCLSQELIPHEQVFDRRINPRKLLLQHTRETQTRAELESIEQTIDELRR